MASQRFYLFGDDPSTERSILLGEKNELKSLQKALAEVYNVAGKQGTYNRSSRNIHSAIFMLIPVFRAWVSELYTGSRIDKRYH